MSNGLHYALSEFILKQKLAIYSQGLIIRDTERQ